MVFSFGFKIADMTRILSLVVPTLVGEMSTESPEMPISSATSGAPVHDYSYFHPIKIQKKGNQSLIINRASKQFRGS